MKIRITAPFVYAKVHDAATGASAMQGFYKDALVEVDDASGDRLVAKGMATKVAADAVAPSLAKEPSVKEILAEVGDDKAKAQAALEAEQSKGDDARSTLVDGLQAVLAKD